MISVKLAVFWVAAVSCLYGDSVEIDWEKERGFWAFKAPVRYPLPDVAQSDWPRQPLDYFVLAELEKRGLKPAAIASRETWARRVSFDITGLPLEPEVLERFLSDASPDSYEALVDRLIDSPAFGERMAGFWLPLARYAEDQAHQVGSDTKHFYPNAYHYRDWVIQAFNDDLPYSQFIRYQLAADLMSDVDQSDYRALGFIGLGPKYYNRGRLEVKAQEWADQVDTVTRAMQGLTVACAQCHDHKYDPITMEDYYALAGVFASTELVNQAYEKPADQMSKEDYEKHRFTIHAVQEGDPQNIPLFLRGDVGSKGPEIPRRYLEILNDGKPRPFKEGSGRLQLAEEIANPSNPLTARVFVNRVWSEMFGRPLVATPSNFGRFGREPTHPLLLDDLAVRFMETGWSIKSLVREIALSSTYRQTSQRDPSDSLDPANQWLGRMNRKRLTAEMWRDAILFVSGALVQADGTSMELEEEGHLKRTVYSRVSRLKLNDYLMQHDYPDANVHHPQRAVTTTPIQKLYALNDPFILEQARVFARRIRQGADENVLDTIRRAYWLAYGRKASDHEIQLAQSFLQEETESSMSRWEQFAQVLLISNEMLYVD